MVILHKNLQDGIIGEVPLTLGEGGPVIGTAQLEKVGTNIIVTMDVVDMPEAVTQGFKLGQFSIYKEIDDE
jgi:hypothetical protein